MILTLLLLIIILILIFAAAFIIAAVETVIWLLVAISFIIGLIILPFKIIAKFLKWRKNEQNNIHTTDNSKDTTSGTRRKKV